MCFTLFYFVLFSNFINIFIYLFNINSIYYISIYFISFIIHSFNLFTHLLFIQLLYLLNSFI